MVGRFLSANGLILSFIHSQEFDFPIIDLEDQSKVNDISHFPLYLTQKRKDILFIKGKI